MTKEEIDDKVCDILCGYGGHCDGHEEMTEFILSLLEKPLIAAAPRLLGLCEAALSTGILDEDLEKGIMEVLRQVKGE